MKKKTYVLCILDGWGEGSSDSGNAIFQAQTPCWDALKSQNSLALLHASGESVGLPVGQMGNSEVGHMTIGSGRVVLQDLPRLSKKLSDPDFIHNPAFQSMVKNLQKTKKACHLLGLLSRGGVHSHTDHLLSLVGYLDQAGIQTYIHSFLDGRDTLPMVAHEELQYFKNKTLDMKHLKIATLGGRYYAMDRDQRWDRIEIAKEAILHAKAPLFQNAFSYIKEAHAQGIGDEFIKPAVLDSYEGFEKGDVIFSFNFRADRMRQILSQFAKDPLLLSSKHLGLVSYSAELDRSYEVVFPKVALKKTLGDVISKANLKQLRIAETEKYAHVTYFFNGGVEKPFLDEDRHLEESPKVATYDLKPEMSALEITKKLCTAIDSRSYDLIVVNYANADMVGHTGHFKATVKAIEALDGCLFDIHNTLKKTQGVLMVTADHGNADCMLDPETGDVLTAHSLNSVPLLLCDFSENLSQKILKKEGALYDIAPTILDLMDLDKPTEMTGHTLLIT